MCGIAFCTVKDGSCWGNAVRLPFTEVPHVTAHLFPAARRAVTKHWRMEDPMAESGERSAFMTALKFAFQMWN